MLNSKPFSLILLTISLGALAFSFYGFAQPLKNAEEVSQESKKQVNKDSTFVYPYLKKPATKEFLDAFISSDEQTKEQREGTTGKLYPVIFNGLESQTPTINDQKELRSKDPIPTISGIIVTSKMPSSNTENCNKKGILESSKNPEFGILALEGYLEGCFNVENYNFPTSTEAKKPFLLDLIEISKPKDLVLDKKFILKNLSENNQNIFLESLDYNDYVTKLFASIYEKSKKTAENYPLSYTDFGKATESLKTAGIIGSNGQAATKQEFDKIPLETKKNYIKEDKSGLSLEEYNQTKIETDQTFDKLKFYKLRSEYTEEQASVNVNKIVKTSTNYKPFVIVSAVLSVLFTLNLLRIQFKGHKN
jgi:hypothetical protein